MHGTYLIAAGGTGGHFYPGVALGRELLDRDENVIFIVKKGSPNIAYLDAQEMCYQEIDFVCMPRGKNIFKWFPFAIKFIKTFLQMRKLIKELNPKYCIGMGGYVSFPLIFAAHVLGYKTAVHDSNSKLGLANKVCAKFVDIFFLGLPVEDAPKNAILVGTPIRSEFQETSSDEEKVFWQFATDFGINLLIFGGSQGARKLNFAAATAAKDLISASNRLHIFHITGTRDFDEIKNIYGKIDNVELIPYTEDIYSLMKASHLIIARSGASSLAEICCLQKPSILVPFPYAAENHQYYNAKILQDFGVSMLIEESEFLSQDLFNAVKKLLSEPKAIKRMQENFLRLTLPNPLNAAKRMVDILQR